MPEPITWGQLPKSQIDPEKIEEAIERMIKEHNEDETAHLGPGQSLQSHKASEIIDHLVKSIIADKIRDGAIPLSKFSYDKFYYISSFESIDGWYTTGTVLQSPGCARLDTEATANSYTWLFAQPYSWSGLQWAKSFVFQTTVKLHDNTNQKAYFGVGGLPPEDDLSFIGFKVVDGVLYAYLHGYKGDEIVEQSQEIPDIDITEFHVYRIVYNKDENKIEYYIDGNLVATFTENFPDNDDDSFAMYYIETTTNEKRYLSVIDVLYSRDR